MIDQFTQDIVVWIQTQPLVLIYLYFLLISYLENVIPPVPGDILVAFSGYLVAENIVDFTSVLVLTVLGSVIGFYHVYYLGEKWGASIYTARQDHWLLKIVEIEYIDKGKLWMSKYGQGVVLANRFLAGTRSVISLVAGMSHLPKVKTLISSTISSIFWNAILIGAGWFVHDNWQLIGTYLANYGKVVLVLIAVIVAWKWYSKRKLMNLKKKSGEEVN